MDTAVVNIKVDKNIKKEAQKIASELGLNLSSLINGYLRQVIRTKTVTFSLEQPSKYFIKSIKESEEDVKAGRVISFEKPDKSIEYVDKLIAQEKNAEKN